MSLQPFRTNIKQLVGPLATYFHRRGGGEHGLYAYHPLTARLTNTTFDGDSFSDVATHTKIENTSWSTTIPSKAVALSVLITARDSASAATAGLYFALYPTDAASAGLVCRPSGQIDNDQATAAGTVACTNGDIWYECNASGASTLDVWLYVTGYWL